MPAWIVGAAWVVRVVEVYYQVPVLGPEVRMFYGIEQVPAATVGLACTRLVSEGKQYSAAVARDPEQRQRKFFVSNAEADLAKTL